MNRPGAPALITLFVPLAAAAQDSSRVTRICTKLEQRRKKKGGGLLTSSAGGAP